MYVEMVLHFPRGIDRLGVSFRGCTSVKHVFLKVMMTNCKCICIYIYTSFEHVNPPKINMSPKKGPFEKESFQPSFFGAM